MEAAHDKSRLAVLLGSVREGRICDTVAGWAVAEVERQGGFTVEVIDPRRLDLAAWRGERSSPTALALREAFERAEAFLVVTPEYNHGYPAAVKALVDLSGREWQAKPVAFVSYGGVSGGLRAVEQLRLVLAEMHAVTLRDTVSIPAVWNRFDETGALREPERPAKALSVLLKRLAWWAETLRSARRTTPYSESAA